MHSKRLRNGSLLVAIMGIVLTSKFVAADQSSTTKWLVGNALVTQMQSRVSVSWTNAPLKESLNNFAIANRVCIVLDRRIDPDQPFDFEARDARIEDVLRGVATKLKLGVSFYGLLVYLGPNDVAAKLKTLAALRTAEVQMFPQKIQSRWLTARPLAWTKPTNPQELLATILKNANDPRLAGVSLPADLWAANAWPKINTIDQLTLLLAQFDLTFRFSDDPETITLIPIPETVTIRKEYSIGNSVDFLGKLKSANLKGIQQINGTKLTLDSTIEEHQHVQQFFLRSQSVKPGVGEGEKRYTLTIKLPVRDLAKGLAPKLGIAFTFDERAIEEAKIPLDQKIDLKVKDATLEQLLDAIFRPAGLKHEKQNDGHYLIRPAK